MASFELRDYVEALRLLEGALAEKRRPLTATQRQQVQALAERARVFVGNFHVRLSPRESVLRVDGTDAALDADDRLQLGFGRHLLTAEAPGRRSEYREITVVGGERQELLFELAPSSALGASGRSPHAARQRRPRPAPDRTRRTKVHRARAGGSRARGCSPAQPWAAPCGGASRTISSRAVTMRWPMVACAATRVYCGFASGWRWPSRSEAQPAHWPWGQSEP